MEQVESESWSVSYGNPEYVVHLSHSEGFSEEDLHDAIDVGDSEEYAPRFSLYSQKIEENANSPPQFKLWCIHMP